MAISTCTVSGTLYSVNNQPLQDVVIEVYCARPFFHTDGTHVIDYKVSTTTDSNGAWSLSLIETATVDKTLTISFEMPTGSVERQRRTYTMTVPNQASANFSDIATEL